MDNSELKIEEINQRIKEVAKKVFGSFKEMDKALGKKQGHISTYLSQKSMLGGETLQILADKHNININWLLTGRGNMLIDSKDNVEIVDTTMQPVPYLTLEAISKMQEDLVLIKKKIGVHEK